MTQKARGLWLAGNWKMNHGRQDAARFFEGVRSAWGPTLSAATLRAFETKELRQTLFAPFLTMETVQAMGRELAIDVGAQNAHGEKNGAFTGEVSAAMLSEIGVEQVLIGHSERRQYFGETDSTVRKRTEGLLAQGVSVLACVGETRAEREAGETEAVLLRQIGALLEGDGVRTPGLQLDSAGRLRFGLAYEPVWAIGTGLTATPAQANEAHRVLRAAIERAWGQESAARVSILYGGSVTPETAKALFVEPQIDGGLVGGASLKSESWLKLLEAAGQVVNAAGNATL